MRWISPTFSRNVCHISAANIQRRLCCFVSLWNRPNTLKKKKTILKEKWISGKLHRLGMLKSILIVTRGTISKKQQLPEIWFDIVLRYPGTPEIQKWKGRNTTCCKFLCSEKWSCGIYAYRRWSRVLEIQLRFPDNWLNWWILENRRFSTSPANCFIHLHPKVTVQNQPVSLLRVCGQFFRISPGKQNIWQKKKIKKNKVK